MQVANYCDPYYDYYGNCSYGYGSYGSYAPAYGYGTYPYGPYRVHTVSVV